MSNKQSGFSIVEGVIAIVAIAVLGFIGWTVYTQQHTKNSSTASSTPSSSTSNSPGKTTVTATTAATVTAQGTYLDIKELGVKVTLSSSISDALYSLPQQQPTDGSKMAYISAQSLIDSETDSKGYCGTSSAPLGIIRESTTAPTSITGPLPVDNKTVFKIGNTYYQYSWGQGSGGCGAATTGVSNSTFTSKLNAFQQAVTTLQPDN